MINNRFNKIQDNITWLAFHDFHHQSFQWKQININVTFCYCPRWTWYIKRKVTQQLRKVFVTHPHNDTIKIHDQENLKLSNQLRVKGKFTRQLKKVWRYHSIKLHHQESLPGSSRKFEVLRLPDDPCVRRALPPAKLLRLLTIQLSGSEKGGNMSKCKNCYKDWSR